jgi:uncharacterized protein with HEPN domain
MIRSQKLFVKDIIDSIEDIEKFIEGLDYEGFVKDDKTISAVIRKIEIIGEATKNLSVEIIGKNKDIPWNKFSQMRDKVIHGYFGVDNTIVWETITIDLPKVLVPLKKLYSKI